MGCSNRLDYFHHWLTVAGLVGLTALIAVSREKISKILHLYTAVGFCNRLAQHWLTVTGLVGLNVTDCGFHRENIMSFASSHSSGQLK